MMAFTYIALAGAIKTRRRFDGASEAAIEDIVARLISGQPSKPMDRVMGFYSTPHLPPIDKNSRRNTRRVAAVSWSGAS